MVSGPVDPQGAFTCPLPQSEYHQVLIAHGGGGRLMQRLIDELFLPAFGNPALAARHDGALLDADGTRIAFTTDSYVVQPLVFPGGDIGRLAVYGTVNDLAMCGAEPAWLSAGFILEEGLPMETLRAVAWSMREAAAQAGVELVTGDTKVVERGGADGLYVNTAGIGLVRHAHVIGPAAVRPGDAVLLSGDVGRHGIAVMAARQGIDLEVGIDSDVAPLAAPVLALLDARIGVHCLRDLTRGGLASALCEIAAAVRVGIRVAEAQVPVAEPVRAACELLGFDPFYVACEGRFIAFVPGADSERALEILRAHPVSAGAVCIGSVTDAPERRVTLETAVGVDRPLDMLSGEQLPRIC